MSETIRPTVDHLPLGPGVRLIGSNEDGLVALDKPAGVMSHPNSHEDRRRSLLDAHYDYEGEVFTWEADGVSYSAWLINRLDSPTSGVILIALDPELTAVIKQKFATHKVSKVYYALVKHAPSVPGGVWRDVLKKDVYQGKRRVKGAQRVSAKTRYHLTKAPAGGFPVALLKLMPLTGRTHQLRMQCQMHGHPIVGDQTYGSFSFNREVSMETGERRLMLHSAQTCVHYAFHGKVCDFSAESPLPESFNVVMGFRPGIHHGRVPQTRPVKPLPKRPLAGRRFKHG